MLLVRNARDANTPAVFTNDRLPRSRQKDWVKSEITVRRGVSIGANATLVCPVSIGAFAFIGAGAVVTRDVPDHALMVGNPAELKGFVCACRKKLKFIRGKAHCNCGCEFRMKSRLKVVGYRPT